MIYVTVQFQTTFVEDADNSGLEIFSHMIFLRSSEEIMLILTVLDRYQNF